MAVSGTPDSCSATWFSWFCTRLSKECLKPLSGLRYRLQLSDCQKRNVEMNIENGLARPSKLGFFAQCNTPRMGELHCTEKTNWEGLASPYAVPQ